MPPREINEDTGLGGKKGVGSDMTLEESNGDWDEGTRPVEPQGGERSQCPETAKPSIIAARGLPGGWILCGHLRGQATLAIQLFALQTGPWLTVV